MARERMHLKSISSQGRSQKGLNVIPVKDLAI